MKPLRAIDIFRRSGLRRRAALSVCASSRRFSATLPPQQIKPARPVLHFTISDAHIHASCLLAELLLTRRPTSLAAYVTVTEAWWRAVGQLVLLPSAAEEIGDLPQYLVECAGVRREQHIKEGSRSPDAQDDEAVLLEKWEEWVWMSMPSTMPTAAAFSETIDANDGDSILGASARREVMSFPQLTSLLYSYTRYHRGVRWGASQFHNKTKKLNDVGVAAAAAYYRRRYFLHPWHGLCCPEGTASQMPYVHVLRWMLAGKESKTSPEELWRQHKALEPFRISSSTAFPFRALDVCSQSGYVTDLLLRAGAGLVVAVDTEQHALGNTESTYHEHFRENRSKRRGQVLLTQVGDHLPMPRRTKREKEVNDVVHKLQEVGLNPDREKDDVYTTSATAAERRRRRARQEGRGYSGVRADSASTVAAAAVSSTSSFTGMQANADGSPFHVIYIHPPTPTTVWPVTSAHAQTSLQSTSWWQSLLRKAAEGDVPLQLLLPFLPCDALPAAATAGKGRRSPFSTFSGLRNTIEALRSDVTEQKPTSLPDSLRGEKTFSESSSFGSGDSDALLSDDGYVVLVLPRTYEVDLLLLGGEGEMQNNGASLADWVVGQLDGYYDLVLRRRCLAHHSPSSTAPLSSSSLSSLSSSAMQLDMCEESLVTYPCRLQYTDGQKEEDVSPTDASAVSGVTRWKEQLTRLYQHEWWHDVLVLKKNTSMQRRCAAARNDDAASLLQSRLSLLRKAKTDVAWEDSFEYNEYRPRDAAQHTSQHWTDLMPTYSYLESQFYDEPSNAQRNFLAVGHQPTLLKAKSTPTGRNDFSIRPHNMTTKETDKDDGGVAAASAQAAMNFHTLFAQELRTRRRSKLRKLALSPLERQEWYIDEKLIKSSAARVDLMNELAKWDLKDYDN